MTRSRDGREAVGHAGRDVHAQVIEPDTADVADVDDLGGTVGRAPLAKIVQHDPGVPGLDHPVVGLMQVIVEPDDAVGRPFTSVGLDHLPPPREPLAAVRLDEGPPLVTMDRGFHDVDSVDTGGRRDGGHGAG